MNKRRLIFLICSIFLIGVMLYAIYYFTSFRPGKFGDLELRKDGTYILKGCSFDEGTYDVSSNQITLFVGEEQYKHEIFKIKIININKLQIIVNNTNCRQYSNAIYKRS